MANQKSGSDGVLREQTWCGLERFIEGTFIFVLGPLLASGVALLWAGKKGEEEEEAN